MMTPIPYMTYMFYVSTQNRYTIAGALLNWKRECKTYADERVFRAMSDYMKAPRKEGIEHHKEWKHFNVDIYMRFLDEHYNWNGKE